MSVRPDFRRAVSALIVWLLTTSLAVAQTTAAKPPVPTGAPTRGLAVALLTTGIDYTQPEVARRLARDGEGELIGFDAVDSDRRPYAAVGEASRLAALSPVYFVPVRVDPARPESIATAFQFLRRAPARIVVVPLTFRDPKTAEAVAAAIDAAKDMLFILAAGDDDTDLDTAAAGSPVPPRRDNTIVVSALASLDRPTKPNRGARSVDVLLVPATALRERPGSGALAPNTSAEAAIMLSGAFACAARELTSATAPSEVKRILLSAARRDFRHPTPLLEVCDRSPGHR